MKAQAQAGETMTFNSLERTNQKLAKNPNLSEHNKEVLETFFSVCRSGGTGDPIGMCHFFTGEDGLEGYG